MLSPTHPRDRPAEREERDEMENRGQIIKERERERERERETEEWRGEG